MATATIVGSNEDPPLPLPEGIEAPAVTPCDDVRESVRLGELDAAVERLAKDGISIDVPASLLDRYAITGFSCQDLNDEVLTYAIGLVDLDTEETLFVESVADQFWDERQEQLKLLGQPNETTGPGTLIRSTTGPSSEIGRDQFVDTERLEPVDVLAEVSAHLLEGGDR